MNTVTRVYRETVKRAVRGDHRTWLFVPPFRSSKSSEDLRREYVYREKDFFENDAGLVLQDQPCRENENRPLVKVRSPDRVRLATFRDFCRHEESQ